MRPRRRDPPPILFLFLTKRERAVDGPREKIAFGRAPVQWPSARTGVSRIGAGKDCRPSAGSRRTVLLSRPCAACSVRQSSGWKIAWPLLLNPLAAPWSREGRPAAAAAQPLAALPLTDAAYPLRVKSTLTVSGASPDRRFPQGQCVSVPDRRAGTPTFPRRRQEVRMYADRPAETFFLFHRAVAQPLAALPPYGCGIPLAGTAHFLFDVSNRGPRRAPRGGERRRSGGSETWPCGPGRTIRSLCRRQWGVHCPAANAAEFRVQWDALSAPTLKGAHYVPPHRSKRDPAGPPDHRHL